MWATLIAASRAVVEAGPGGKPRYTSLGSAPPLLLRPTPGALYLVGGAGGPLGGDDISLELRLGPGAALTVRSLAATVARLGPVAKDWSRLRISVDLAAGAKLSWMTEPGVASRHCRHSLDVQVRMASGCSLTWRDELVLGRHGERPGSWTTSVRVDLDGRPLLRQRLDVGPHAPGWDGPAILGDARALGSLLIVDPALAVAPPLHQVSGGPALAVEPPLPHIVDPALAVAPPLCQVSGGNDVRVMALAGPGLYVSALAHSALALRQLLDHQAARLGYHAT